MNKKMTGEELREKFPKPPTPISEQNSPLNLNFCHIESLEPWPHKEKYNLLQVARETKQKIDERIGRNE